MVKKNAQQVFGDTQFEPIRLNSDDFTAAPAEGTSVPAGEVEEILRAEIGEDGQLDSYDALQLGGRTDAEAQSALGKLFINLKDGADANVDPRTQVRFVARPKNGNRRTALTEWYTVRDLGRDDPRQRIPLPPVTSANGDPQIVKEGRIVAMEVRNPATSVTVSKANSTTELPATAGY